MQICHDEVFGVLTVSQAGYRFRRTKNHTQTYWPVEMFIRHRERFNRPIVLVIESPHIKEFQVRHVTNALNGLPVYARPANGATGENICTHFAALLATLPQVLAQGHYPVVVVNAIQLQCSQGEDTCLYRTRRFIEHWPARVDDLTQRLRILDPVIAINACTKGDFYIRDEAGQLTRTKAFDAGFNPQFNRLLEQEFGYQQELTQTRGQAGGECAVVTPPEDDDTDSLRFMNTIDLSGLVMYQLHQAYKQTDTLLCKTTHPAAWLYRVPMFTRFRQELFTYTKSAPRP